jgi:hypothetical protein
MARRIGKESNREKLDRGNFENATTMRPLKETNCDPAPAGPRRAAGIPWRHQIAFREGNIAPTAAALTRYLP